MVTITTYILLLISLTFNIFILCYIGELLIQKVYFSCAFKIFVHTNLNIQQNCHAPQTSEIGLSCFSIDWYYLPAKTARGLVLIIAMSSKPAKISAGKITDLNLSTFASVSLCRHIVYSCPTLYQDLTLVTCFISSRVISCYMGYEAEPARSYFLINKSTLLGSQDIVGVLKLPS